MTKHSTNPIRCPHCGGELPWPVFNTEALTHCPFCLDVIQVAVFPALYDSQQMDAVLDIAQPNDENACCFYHPDKKAVIVCEHCGRFLCALCHIEFGTHHFCSGCIESGTKKKRLDNLQQDVTLYGDLAMAIALLGFLMWPFGVILGPISLYFVIRHWHSPHSLIRQTKSRFIIALLLALITTSFSLIIYLFLFSR